MSMTTARTDTLPWYRQFWPWFLIALPASTVVACMVTIWLAVTNPDTLVKREVPAGSAYRPQSEVRAAWTEAGEGSAPRAGAPSAEGAADARRN